MSKQKLYYALGGCGLFTVGVACTLGIQSLLVPAEDKMLAALEQSLEKVQEEVSFDPNLSLDSDPDALYDLAMRYEWGDDVSCDIERAVRYLEAAAHQGHTQAMVDLAFRYEIGHGVAENPRQAAYWYRKGAKAGSDECMVKLASLYERGFGVAQDTEKAFKLYSDAAKLNHPLGFYAMGVYHKLGQHVEQSDEKYIEFLEAAGRLDFPPALFDLGYAYETGKGGVEQCYSTAARKYRLAADLGHAESQYRLAGMYRLGLGVPQDLVRAAEWYQKAGEQDFYPNEDYVEPQIDFLSSDSESLAEEYTRLVEESGMGEANRQVALRRVKNLNSWSAESQKSQAWLDGLLDIPFGKYAETPLKYPEDQELVPTYLQNVRANLDQAVFGQDEAKESIMRLIGQWLSRGNSKGEILAIQGPPGNGKTTLVKKGIAKALNRPFVSIPLGGASDGAYLAGSDSVYVGSHWGEIVSGLMNQGVMNPIIYLDELDKVSQTERGREIVNILVHLTDPAQNENFHDHFFQGIDIDLSRALIVFSYNDERKIDPVLLDRITIIQTDPLRREEKLKIAENYLWPEILSEINLSIGDIVLDESAIEEIVDNYTLEAGARRLKESLLTLAREINLQRMLGNNTDTKPVVNRETVKKVLKDPAIDFFKAGETHEVGSVNGLFATTAGFGGLMPVQTSPNYSASRLQIELTGNAGMVMRESSRTAKTVAYSLLSSDSRRQLEEDPPFGIHVHLPHTATPKDGPSAGAALTASLVSTLTNTPVRQDVAVTGEIDLRGRVTKIGGVDSKLQGAKQAGISLVLVPEENRPDVERILEKSPKLFDESFQIKYVSRIEEVLDELFVEQAG